MHNIFRTIIVIEKQQQIHKTIRYQSKPSKSNGVCYIYIYIYIYIPIDKIISWNEIPKHLADQHWKRIKDLEMYHK